jgi:CRP/FNR family transcriptional regulator
VLNHNVNAVEYIEISCQNCNLDKLCIPLGLDAEEIEKFDHIIKRNHPLHRGDYLFRKGECLQSLFVLRTGSVKIIIPSEDGYERVVGFYFPGEITGLDGIQQEIYLCSAKVLETCAVCEIPFRRLEELTSNIPSLRRQMYRLLSREISHDTSALMLVSKKNAEERLAAFLLNLSNRFKIRGLSATDFYLSMSRYDISNYLGLAVETVSRLFTRFQEEGLLLIDKRHVQLLDIHRLETMVAKIHINSIHTQ